MTVDNIYRALSERRKKEQAEGLYPEWFTSGGFQIFTNKYAYEENGYLGRAKTIAKTAAKHTHDPELYEKKFFDLIWKGWLSCSTPVLSNMGTERGMPVSCSGTYTEDSVDGFYNNLHENAVLSKYGFGTSSYLGDIRPRGSIIKAGGKASGVMPVLKNLVQMTRDITQGTQRRGAIASYLPIDHGDYWEVVDYLKNDPDDLNIGWCIPQSFIDQLNSEKEGGVRGEATKRYQRSLFTKMMTGRGYYFFPDKANNNRPEWYKKHNLDIKASQLCSEIMLHSDKDHSYTCVLSSMNLAKWDEWKDTDAVFTATIFLDCVAQEFIEKAKGINGLEKAVRFTEKSRALGLGVCGFHTLLQQKKIPFEDLTAHLLNNIIFKYIRDEAEKATKFMYEEYTKLGRKQPEWLVGYERWNSHLIAIAPTKSTALIMGGVSEGINPDPAMTFTQASAGGEIERINPTLLTLMKEKGVSGKKYVQEVIDAKGSVQGVDWLTDEEKQVFKNAFEINQKSVLRLASTRARYIDQWQSLNLFFSAEEDEGYISEVHKEAFLDPSILALYYCYSRSGVNASKGDCEACQ